MSILARDRISTKIEDNMFKLKIKRSEGEEEFCSVFEVVRYAIAEPKDSDAQYRYAMSYAKGINAIANPGKAYYWMLRSAENGCAKAQNAMGETNIDDSVWDIPAAKRWFTLAAVQGDAKALCFLGTIYFYGEHEKKDYGKSFEFFRRSAEKGYANAMSFLGMSYEDGLGIEQDPEKALCWYEKAKEAGDDLATMHIAGVYLNRDSGMYEPEMGIQLLREVADTGDAEYQYFLAVAYGDEKIGINDQEKCNHWLKIASENGCKDATEELIERGIYL